MSPAKAAPAVRFEATLCTIGGSAVVRLPEKASDQLPSRGQVAVQAAVNGHACQTVAEPDGESGHWVRIDAEQQRAAALRAGDTAEVDQSAMIHLAYAVSEPRGPREVGRG